MVSLGIKEEFGDNEQKSLANFCRMISNYVNVLWMLSYSDCSAKNPEGTMKWNLK